MRQEKRYGTKRLLAEFLNKTFATHTVKRLQRKIDDIWTVNRQQSLAVEENEKLLLKKRYRI